MTGKCAKAIKGLRLAKRLQFSLHRVDIVVVINVYVLRAAARWQHGREKIIIEYAHNNEQTDARRDEISLCTVVFHCCSYLFHCKGNDFKQHLWRAKHIFISLHHLITHACCVIATVNYLFMHLKGYAFLG